MHHIVTIHQYFISYTVTYDNSMYVHTVGSVFCLLSGSSSELSPDSESRDLFLEAGDFLTLSFFAAPLVFFSSDLGVFFLSAFFEEVAFLAGVALFDFFFLAYEI